MSGFDIWDSYNQYYLVELPDHTFILAQIPQTEADAIVMGKNESESNSKYHGAYQY